LFKKIGFTAAILLILSACKGGDQPLPQLSPDIVFERPNSPDQYSGRSNPFDGSTENIASGEELYQKFCLTCHGVEGKGDGPASASLDPAPQDLAYNQRFLSDSYLFWRISEGGSMDPFNSSMPPWKGVLEEESIWKMILFIRTLGH